MCSGSVTPCQPSTMGFSLAKRRTLFYQQARQVLTLAGPSRPNKSQVAPRGYCLLDELSCQHSYIYREREREKVNFSVFECADMCTMYTTSVDIIH